VKVVSVACDGFPWKAPIHIARAGNAVIVGLDRKLVAGTTLAMKGVKPPEFDGPSVGLGVIRPAAYPNVFAPVGQAIVRSLLPAPNPNGGGIIMDDFVPNRGPFAPPPLPLNEGDEKHPAWGKLKKSAEALPPTVVHISRSGATIRLEAWQRGLDTGLGPLTDGFLEWLEKAIGGAVNGGQQVVDGPIEKG
jgi:hypothetical protein